MPWNMVNIGVNWLLRRDLAGRKMTRFNPGPLWPPGALLYYSKLILENLRFGPKTGRLLRR
jgi:hypothetical protein